MKIVGKEIPPPPSQKHPEIRNRSQFPLPPSSMAIKLKVLGTFMLLFLTSATINSASIPFGTLKPSFPEAISGLKETVVKAFGTQREGWEISGFDARDAFVGQSMVYEFHVEIDKKVFPVKLLEDFNWSPFVDIWNGGKVAVEGKELSEVGKLTESRMFPVLSPFQLAGPMEIWIQDGDDMRLSLPHDVDAGVLRKVILTDGAVITVKGARSVSLRYPVELPLPLNRSGTGNVIASGLLALSEALRGASRIYEKPLVSLRIEGPTSLTSSSSTSNDNVRLKLKRIAPGLVELSSPTTAVAQLVEESDAPTLWPLTSLNGSNSNLRGIEELLASVLGEKANKVGSFRLVKGEVSAKTYVKLNFRMTASLTNSEVDWSGYPEWRTRPEKMTSDFEVLARVEDNGDVIPERISEVQPIEIQDTVLDSVVSGNMTMSQVPVYHPPPSFFTL